MYCGICETLWVAVYTYYWWTVEYVKPCEWLFLPTTDEPWNTWNPVSGCLYLLLMNRGICETLQVLMNYCWTVDYVNHCEWLSTYYSRTVEYVKHYDWLSMPTIDELWNMWNYVSGCLATVDELWNMRNSLSGCLPTIDELWNMWNTVNGCLPTTGELWNLWNSYFA